MSNLLTTSEGMNAVQTAQKFLLERRLSRFFKRNLVIAYNEWLQGNGFSLSKLLGELNVSHDTEIKNLFRLLGIAGGLPVSVASTRIYVDPVAGSDDTGDGTDDRPYQTLWFLNSLPRRIEHEYFVLFKEDLSLLDELVLDFNFAGDGFVGFVGVGAPIVIAGPFEVLTTGLLDGGSGRYIQTSTPYGANYSGDFLLVNDGTANGAAQAIHSLAAADTVLTLADSFSGLAPGDHVSVVRPLRGLSVRKMICSCSNGSGYSNLVHDGARLGFVNLKIAITNTNDARESFLVDNTCVQQMSFCQLYAPDDGTFRIKSGLNTLNGSTLSGVYSESGITNIIDSSADPQIAGLAIQDMGKNYPGIIEGPVRWMSNRQLIDLRCCAEIDHVSAERLSATSANANITACIVQGRILGDDTGAGIETSSSVVHINGLIVLNSENALTIRSNSQLTISDTGADGTYSTLTQYGSYFLGCGVIELRDAGSRLIGATNAVYFATVNPGVAAALPAAYGFQTDAQLSMLKRLGV